MKQDPIAIEMRDVRRIYTSANGIFKQKPTTREALKGISLQVQRGEIFGLLGPNGAGKTTLTKILATILLPTSGEITIDGFDVVRNTNAVRQRIGLVLGGERGLYYRLTARENLEFWGTIYRLDSAAMRRRIPELLELVGLADRANDRVEAFSRGMKQRIHLARGLLNNPSVLFLDEPTTGLDPVAALEFREIIRGLQASGMTIFLTTHLMDEAETLCDRVAFINKGQIILLDTPRGLTRQIDSLHVLTAEFALQQPVNLARIELLPGVQKALLETHQDYVVVKIWMGGADDMPPILRELAEQNVRRVNSSMTTLEDVYLQLIGKQGMSVV